MAKDFLYCEETDTHIYSNDVVTITTHPESTWLAKKGWYKLGTAQKNGWYFVSIKDRTILPIDLVNINDIVKDNIAVSELHPTLKDIDTPNPVNDYIVIPGTNIRLYDGDIVKLSNSPKLKWIIHLGWFVYSGSQNFGWYLSGIKTGEVLPVSVIDLTTCTLVTVKTQGSEIYDGKVVNYTRPFTLSDAIILNKTFITVDTIEQRDNIDKKYLANGRLVRVNNVSGAPIYYAWNSETESWDAADFGGSPELIGSTSNPIILSGLESGLYRVKGTYMISEKYGATVLTPVDHLVFVNQGTPTEIKVITESEITDYQLDDTGDVFFVNNYATYKYLEDNYATHQYVEDKATEVVESEIAELLSTFSDRVVDVLNDVLGSISETYINNLFN